MCPPTFEQCTYSSNVLLFEFKKAYAKKGADVWGFFYL